MNETLVYIPKKWRWSRTFDDVEQRYEYHTAFGTMKVSRIRADFEPENQWQSWKWGYETNVRSDG